MADAQLEIRYIGKKKGGKKDGYGSCAWSSGASYIGEWKDDLRDGSGTYIWPDGSKYVGYWKEDKMHGQGVLYNADGTLRNKGIWEQDMFIADVSEDETISQRKRYEAILKDIEEIWDYDWIDNGEEGFSKLITIASRHVILSYTDTQSQIPEIRKLALLHEEMIDKHGRYKDWPTDCLEIFREGLIERLKSVLPQEFCDKIPAKKDIKTRLLNLHQAIKDDFYYGRNFLLIDKRKSAIESMKKINLQDPDDKRILAEILVLYYCARYYTISTEENKEALPAREDSLLSNMLMDILPLTINEADFSRVGYHMSRLIEPYFLSWIKKEEIESNPLVVLEATLKIRCFIPGAVFYTGMFLTCYNAEQESQKQLRYLLGLLAAVCMQDKVSPEISIIILEQIDLDRTSLSKEKKSILIPQTHEWIGDFIESQGNFLMKYKRYGLAINYLILALECMKENTEKSKKIYMNISECYMNMGNKEEAEQWQKRSNGSKEVLT